ncbi:MAG TPA: FecR domain-containing protein [Dongiaceae bacterium]|nr:FecR domain-containing protein [Dongiaceae bacterium]
MMDDDALSAPEQPAPEHLVLQQAAQWFAVLSDEEVSREEVDQWQRWLGAHPEHQRAWQYVERIGQRFQQAQTRAGRTGASQVLTSSRRDRLTRRRLLQGGVIGVAAWFSWRFTPLPAAAQNLVSTWTADHRSAFGEIRQFALADGGQLWLNSASAVDIHYRDDRREIHLHSGEILIQTAQDPAHRPFVVITSQGNLHALGTRFTVQQRDRDTLLAVYEGAVAITTRDGNTQTIRAGQQTVFDTHAIDQPQTASRAREVWSKGLIVADHIPLQDLVAELGRYRHGYLGIDPAVANIPVIGTFPANQPDHALAMLEDALPVRIHRVLPWWIAVMPKNDPEEIN